MFWIISAALAPVVLLFVYILVKDMRQPEPLKWLFRALFFGVLAALLDIMVLSPLPDIQVTDWLSAFANAFLPRRVPNC